MPHTLPGNNALLKGHSPNTPWKVNMVHLKITYLKRKIIWTKPPWLCSMLIFGGVIPLNEALVPGAGGIGWIPPLDSHDGFSPGGEVVNLMRRDAEMLQVHEGIEDCTWRIIKWLVTTIYKPFRPFVRGTTLLRGLTNHGYYITTY